MPTAPFVAATYVSITKTCPPTCVFKDHGCFAQNGFIRRFTRPLDDQAVAEGLDGTEVARNEARCLDKAYGGGEVPQDGRFGGRDLRLHVGGDTADTTSALILASAAKRWRKRGGGEVWTFTHRWREIPANSWGPIHVWASTETVAEAQEAQRLGYRASITLPTGSFTGDKEQVLTDGTTTQGINVIPCPWETRKIPCNRCRLCLRAKLPGDPVIGFQVHGSTADIAVPLEAVRRKRRLAVLG